MLADKIFDLVICAENLLGDGANAMCQFIKANPETQRVSFAMLVDNIEIALASVASPEEWLKRDDLSRPDDIIGLNLGPNHLLLRVQILLRLRRYLEEINASIVSLMAVAEDAEEQDKRARGHCKRLSVMAVLLGSVTGCDEWELTVLERAGYLHDIGLIAIPGAIPLKSEKLTAHEFHVMKAHCVLGVNLCKQVAALRPVLPVIRHHHERMNGTGYP